MEILPDINCHSTNCLLPNVGSKSRLIEIVLGSIPRIVTDQKNM